MIRILLADGRKMLREGLSLLLERHADLKVVGEADEGAACVKLVAAVPADVVVLHSTAPARESTALVRAILKACRTVRIIALTMHPTANSVKALVEAGVAGCLTKECAAAELVSAIRSVMAGDTYLSPRIADVVVRGYVMETSAKSRPPKALSLREQEILQQIAEGHATKEIARTLGLSIKTVETHRRRMMTKLNRHSVAELTKYAVLEGLTSLESKSSSAAHVSMSE